MVAIAPSAPRTPWHTLVTPMQIHVQQHCEWDIQTSPLCLCAISKTYNLMYWQADRASPLCSRVVSHEHRYRHVQPALPLHFAPSCC